MSAMIETHLIVAVASNHVIGSEGDMPWRLPTDLKRFKAVTMGKPIIMGRKTYESIGRALPGRLNIIVSRQEGYQVEGCVVVSSIETAIELAKANALALDQNAICIIGGGQIYAETFAMADKLFVTHVEGILDGDTVFPTIKDKDWLVIDEERPPQGEKDSHAIRFLTYSRRSSG